MSMFDRLCQFVESVQMPAIESALREAAVFDIRNGDEPLMKVAPADLKALDLAHVNERFQLPFPVTAILSDQHCMVYWRYGDVVGADLPYDELATCPTIGTQQFFKMMGMYAPDPKTLAPEQRQMSLFFTGDLKLGEVSMNEAHGIQASTSGRIHMMMRYDHSTRYKGEPMYLDPKDTLSSRGVEVAAGEIANFILLNTPKRFVVEMTPKRVRTDAVKIARLHERKTFTLLSLADIQTRYIRRAGEYDPATGQTLKTGHPRRSHDRYLASERFKDKRNTWVRVPACWVGPQEAKIGNRHYKIRVDL